MPGRADYARLERLLDERGDALLRTAVLLTGRREAGEDLLQSALEKVLRSWRRVDGDPEGYLRRTMYHLSVDRWRRLARRGEVFGLEREFPVEGHAEQIEQRVLVLRALAQLPPRQRAAVVLRYFEHLSEADTASVLRCSVGTVKSQTSRALAHLRNQLGAGAPEPIGCLTGGPTGPDQRQERT